jgi:hypothetical protein
MNTEKQMNFSQESKVVVKLYSPWHTEDLLCGNVCFSPNVALQEADAALWEYQPDEAMLEYSGPKAWLSWEPQWHGMYRKPLVRKLRKVLKPSEWLHYAHPQAEYRVPHITQCGTPAGFYGGVDRVEAAVAIVSNGGGRCWFLRPGLRLRNRFVTHPMVRLHGRRQGWKQFQKWGPLSPRALPENYQGELVWKEGWMAESQVEFLSRFQVAVCMENSIEPYYFTEKFVNAARAGCVPVYHAHPTVREGVLRGAAWIDPADYQFDVSRTIQAALAAPLSDVHSANRLWLERPEVRATYFHGVWDQLGNIFSQKKAEANA